MGDSYSISWQNMRNGELTARLVEARTLSSEITLVVKSVIFLYATRRAQFAQSIRASRGILSHLYVIKIMKNYAPVC